jgi:hypothetical protein
MTVLCRAADGRETLVRVGAARNDEHACRLALAQLDPAEGWQAVVVL